MASRLRECIRPDDLISRFGGDEFVVICCPHDMPTDTARALADRIQSALAHPLAIGDVELTIGCSIGVAYFRTDDNASDVDDLLRRADSAMYIAKRTGGGAVAVDERAVATGAAHS